MKIASAFPWAAFLLVGVGCGTVPPLSDGGRERFEGRRGWSVVRNVPFIPQEGRDDCGAAALAMVLSSQGRVASMHEILSACPPSAGGIRAAELRDFARRRGMEAFLFAGSFEDLEREIGEGRPVLVGLVHGTGTCRVAHYEVAAGVNSGRREIALVNPASGWRRLGWDEFRTAWDPAGRLAMTVAQSAD
ncbi:MAG TPA: cysteine peptidase family C39 domain-containing protein [Planctomycetota bacterium]|nr:cysteine peptidase family C39 domain-containing protein [Planctomycetota bacterium]